VKIEREDWTARQPEMETNNLVFLAENSSNTGMTRQHSRSLGGKRVVDYAPDVRFERLTMLSSVRVNCEIVPCIFEHCSFHTDAKLFFVEK